MANGYGGNCPVARALDVIGEKWSLLVLRDLFRKGPLRFQQLEEGLDGVAPNTLSARLKSLESAGVIATRLYESHNRVTNISSLTRARRSARCSGRCIIGASIMGKAAIELTNRFRCGA